MSIPSQIKNLRTAINQLAQIENELTISYRRCKKFELQKSQSEDLEIEFEALARRFTRLVDMLIHKCFRAIDIVELIDTGTLIDTINRAEKRGLIESAIDVRALKDLRNEIAHEYLTEKLTLLHEEVYQSVPKVLKIITNTISYAARYS